jgi:membrane protease YdiL (CAAX protease family)
MRPLDGGPALRRGARAETSGPGRRAVALGAASARARRSALAVAQWLLRQAGVQTHGELGLLRSDDFGWLLLLAVIAAPLCEEYIFRGLVFGGLERLWGFRRAALGSALIFAVVHPMLSAPTVFLLGLSTAFVYARSGMLLAPIVTHVVYNAAVIAGGHWMATHPA